MAVFHKNELFIKFVAHDNTLSKTYVQGKLKSNYTTLKFKDRTFSAQIRLSERKSPHKT